MTQIVNQVKVFWDWKGDRIAKEFGFFSYCTGAPRWNQINMYIVENLLEELGAVECATDGLTGLMAVFEVQPENAPALIARVTKELQNGDLSRLAHRRFYPYWVRYRRMRRAQGDMRIVHSNAVGLGVLK